MTFRIKCPNCNSKNFKETLSREYCPDCGLECCYSGKGSNSVYDDYLARKHAAERDAEWDEDFKWRNENFYGL